MLKIIIFRPNINKIFYSSEPITEKSKFVCPSSDGLFADEKNCGKYYQCTNNVAEEKECPQGELFDIEKGACNDEDDTNCGDRKHPMGMKIT